MPPFIKNQLDFILVIKNLLLGVYYCILRRKHIYSPNRKIGLINDYNRLITNDYCDFDMSTDVQDMKSIKQTLFSSSTLCVGAICGLAGALIDMDHIPGFILHIRVPPVYLIPGFFEDVRRMGGGRPFHNLILVLACFAVMFTLTVLFQYNVRMFAVNAIAATKKAIGTAIADQ